MTNINNIEIKLNPQVFPLFVGTRKFCEHSESSLLTRSVDGEWALGFHPITLSHVAELLEVHGHHELLATLPELSEFSTADFKSWWIDPEIM